MQNKFFLVGTQFGRCNSYILFDAGSWVGQVSFTEITHSTQTVSEEFAHVKGGLFRHGLARPTGWHGAAQRIIAYYLAICAAMLLVNHHVHEWPDFQLLNPSEEPALREPPNRLYGVLEQLLFVIPARDGEPPSNYFWEGLGRSGKFMTGED